MRPTDENSCDRDLQTSLEAKDPKPRSPRLVPLFSIFEPVPEWWTCNFGNPAAATQQKMTPVPVAFNGVRMGACSSAKTNHKARGRIPLLSQLKT